MNYAYVVSGSIGKVYHTGQGYTTPDGTRYPSNIWRNKEWLGDNNLYEIIPASRHDETFYKNAAPGLVWDSESSTVKQTITRKDRSVEDIKATLKNSTFQGMIGSLVDTQWHLDRKASQASYSIPDDVAAYRRGIYEKYDSYIASIDAASDLDELKALMIQTDLAGNVTGSLWDWGRFEDFVLDEEEVA